jgi:hypothetical protein
MNMIEIRALIIDSPIDLIIGITIRKMTSCSNAWIKSMGTREMGCGYTSDTYSIQVMQTCWTAWSDIHYGEMNRKSDKWAQSEPDEQNKEKKRNVHKTAWRTFLHSLSARGVHDSLSDTTAGNEGQNQFLDSRIQMGRTTMWITIL